MEPKTSTSKLTPKTETVVNKKKIFGTACPAVPIKKAKKVKNPNENIPVNAGDTEKKDKTNRRHTAFLKFREKKTVDTTPANVGDTEKSNRRHTTFLSFREKKAVNTKPETYTPKLRRRVSAKHSGVPVPEKMRILMEKELSFINSFKMTYNRQEKD